MAVTVTVATSNESSLVRALSATEIPGATIAIAMLRRVTASGCRCDRDLEIRMDTPRHIRNWRGHVVVVVVVVIVVNVVNVATWCHRARARHGEDLE